MRGPTEHSTLPDTSGPTDDHFVYHLTPAAQQLLAEHEQATRAELHRPAARCVEVTEAAEREARRRRRKARAARARRRGKRFGTVSYRWREGEYVPLLRLSGKSLRRAGFDRQQEFEIAVQRGRLVIEAL
jgi:hypothetical protein